MTEAERYEKKGPTLKKQKASPQELWMETIQSSVDSAPTHLKHHVQRIADLDNIPRKPKQFINFAANSLKIRESKNGNPIVMEIWDFLKNKQQETKSTVDVPEQADDKKQQDRLEEPTENVVEDHRKSVAVEEKSSLLNDNSNGSATETKHQVNDLTIPKLKDVRKAMRRVLKKTTGKSLHMKHLSRKVRELLGIPKEDNKILRKLVRRGASGGKKFVLDDKRTITLKVD